MNAGPTLTVRSMAEILHAPIERKARVLRGQKYPKQGSQVFRTPYYSHARTGIRRYYRNGNAASALAEARRRIESISLESKRDNNQQVLDSFQADAFQFERKLRPQCNTRHSGRISSVHLRLSADMKALEDGAARYIYYHWKRAALPGRLAEETLQIAHLVLEQNGVEVPISNLEFIDLFTGKVHKVRSRSAETEKLLRANARMPAATATVRTAPIKLGDVGRASVRGQVGPFDGLKIAGDQQYAPLESHYDFDTPEWVDKRDACDCYLLGSMATFLFAGTGMTQLYLLQLDAAHYPSTWRGTFKDMIPILLDAQSKALQIVEKTILPAIRPELLAVLRELTHPDPEKRGDPRARAQTGRPVGMERYVSRFSALASRAEFELRTQKP